MLKEKTKEIHEQPRIETRKATKLFVFFSSILVSFSVYATAQAAILPTPGQSCAYEADKELCKKNICPKICRQGLPRIPGGLASGTIHEQGCVNDDDYVHYYCNTGVCVPAELKGAALSDAQRQDPAYVPCNYTLDDLVTVGIRISQWIISIAGGLALLFFAYAGNQWITSMGNPEHIQQAKKTLTAAFVGLMIILASAFLLDYVVSAILGFTPGSPARDTGAAQTDPGFRVIVPGVCSENNPCEGTNMICGTEQRGIKGVCQSKCDVEKGPQGYSCIQLGCAEDDDCNNREQGVTGNKCFGVQGGGGYCMGADDVSRIGSPTLECEGGSGGRGYCERDPASGATTYRCCRVKN